MVFGEQFSISTKGHSDIIDITDNVRRIVSQSLGTWQQIVVIDHDNRKRQRDVFVQVLGE